MSVFDTVQAVRPEVAPMPLADRRMIRETLFGVGHQDASHSIGERSASGAVVSTAPHGTRVPLRSRPRSTGSLVRMVAGLLVLAGIGAVAWIVLADDADDSNAPAASVAATTEPTPENTPPPPTQPPFVRTGVSRSAPLILPPSLLRVDEVTVTPPFPGSGSLLLTAPDGSLLWMAEFDGEAPDVDGLDVRQVGAIGIGVPRDRDESATPSYQILTPCGLVIVNDAPGATWDRPEIVSLFESMSVDGDATIDASLPAGFSVLDIGDATTSYAAVFRVPVFTDTRPARLVQIPNGPISQLTFGGRQLTPVTFLGGPAFLDSAPAVPELVSIFWQDGSTAFNISSAELNFADLESFVASLEPASTSDWSTRFDTPLPAPGQLATDCAPQPDFGPTLDP